MPNIDLTGCWFEFCEVTTNDMQGQPLSFVAAPKIFGALWVVFLVGFVVFAAYNYLHNRDRVVLRLPSHWKKWREDQAPKVATAFLLSLMFALTGCGAPEYSAYRDPFGMTTREDIRANRDVQIVELQSDAVIQAAEFDYKAKSDVAYYEASAIKTQARQATARSVVWAAVSPWLVLLIGLSVIIVAMVVQAGRILFRQVEVTNSKALPHWDDIYKQ